ncbi:uncharacterized protein FYW47_016298 [Aplochiton taeniatus]
MEESFETFEEELGVPKSKPFPQKPVRQIRGPERYTSRNMKEDPAPAVQQQVPKTLPREPSFPIRTMSLRKSLSIQNLSQIDTPWENVTLNRCLLVAITILVLTSGCQRLNEVVRGRRTVEEEEDVGLVVRRSALRHRAPPEPETSLWEVMFWWLPDFDDDDDGDEEDDENVPGGRSKKGGREKASRSLRNKRLPEQRLTKQGGGKLKDRRAKKDREEETKSKKRERGKQAQQIENEDDEEETEDEEEEVIPKKKSREEPKVRKDNSGKLKRT